MEHVEHGTEVIKEPLETKESLETKDPLETKESLEIKQSLETKESFEIKQSLIKKLTHKEIAFLKQRRYPWKSRIRKSTFLPMIPRPGFGNIIHIRQRLSHKLKR
jgi:hypothetical protein